MKLQNIILKKIRETFKDKNESIKVLRDVEQHICTPKIFILQCFIIFL